MVQIAIVGIGCRLPGAKNAQEFWESLLEGKDSVSEVPKERWDNDSIYDPRPATIGKTNTKWGGFIENVDRFDASFFGISPREAERMDPQQRFVLETAWEALEDAFIDPKSISGSKTGVILGMGNYDYGRMLSKDLGHINAYDGTGNTLCIAANRLSYFLNLRGPSLVVESACSSSLVAVHYACKSLSSGESNMCLVGGVSLMLSPEPTITYSQARMMSPTGRCRTFDKAADGYVRGEGCVVLVLRRLEDAIRANDSIYAIIKGSAINQDGKSNGLTAPNGLAQQEVIRAALEDSGLEARDISYVEAHGTGTPLGDPLEMEALEAVYGRCISAQDRCYVGSVKTNIGHLEAAAGAAGLVKVALMVKQGWIPRSLHLNTLNPYIDLSKSRLHIATKTTLWSNSVRPRRGAVSSFGFGGTNVHVIIEGAEADGRKSATDSESIRSRPYQILALSAPSREGLHRVAMNIVDISRHWKNDHLTDICGTAARGRAHFSFRSTVVGSTSEEIYKELQTKIQKGQLAPPKFPKKKNVAFLFTGQGSQYEGMGKELFESESVFREELLQCNSILFGKIKTNITDLIFGGPDALTCNRLDQTQFTQPALFSLEYALAKQWLHWGIVPDLLVGHSLGEFVAATVADIMTLEDALFLIAERGRLIQSLPAGGVMFAVHETRVRLQEMINDLGVDVSIATVNGSHSCVLSGLDTEVAKVIESLRNENLLIQKLPVSHAFHSQLMEGIVDEFYEYASHLNYESPKIPFFSNLIGGIIKSSEVDASYWSRHLRESVRFDLAIEHLATLGPTALLEVGPKPTLLSLVKKELNTRASDIRFIPSLHPKQNDVKQMLLSMGELYSLGLDIEWPAVYPDKKYTKYRLPFYPFEKKRYWADCAQNPVIIANEPVDRSLGVASELNRPADQGLVLRRLEELRESRGTDARLMDSLAVVIQALNSSSPTKDDNAQQIGISASRIEWVATDHDTRSAARNSIGDWIILSEDRNVGRLIADSLLDNGRACRDYLLGDNIDEILTHELGDSNTYANSSIPRNVLIALKSSIQESEPQPNYDSPSDPARRTKERLSTILHVLQKVILEFAHPEVKFWFLTSDGVRVADHEAVDPSLQAVWGFIKVFGLERPHNLQAIIDLPSRFEHGWNRTLVSDVLLLDPPDSLLAVRGSTLLSPRLRGMTLRPSSREDLSRNGCYLITGGHGSLGLRITSWLVEAGVKKIVVLGRSHPTPEVAQRLDRLQTNGTHIKSVVLDVCNRHELSNLVDELSRGEEPLLGIFHCAGSTSYHEIDTLSTEELHNVLRSKVEGGWNLHLATKELDLNYFVTFSSIASVWGSRGQAHYAAANAFLDGLCQMRATLGKPALAVNWGPWEGTGMVKAEFRDVLEKMGVYPIDPQSGIDALSDCINLNLPDITLARIDWNRFTPLYESKANTHLLSEMVASQGEKQSEEKDQQVALGSESDIATLLSDTSEESREQVCIKIIKEILTPLLGFVKEEELDIDVNLFEIGVDSLIAMDIVSSLRTRVGKDIAFLDLTEANSVRSLARLVLEALGYEPSIRHADHVVNLQEEACLPLDLQGGPSRPLTWRKPKKILLIGATGFLGAYLLRDLLDDTDAFVSCIVRTRAGSDEFSRIKENLVTYGLWREAYRRRIHVFSGDISEQQFGLDDITYNDLLEEIDTVIHSAAVLNFVLPYERLRANNVQGTLETLRFSMQGRPKVLHYISTDAVYDADQYYECTVAEDQIPISSDGIDLGYTQTKWVSERLVDKARHHGLIANIYRPPLISGDTQHGRWNTEDFTSLFIKGCIQMHAIPDIDAKITFVPVDFVSRAVVTLTLDKSSLGGNYHLTNPNDTTWRDIVSWLNSCGYKLKTIPYEEWERILISESSASTNVLAPLLPFFLRRWSHHKYNFAQLAEHRVRLATAKTSAILERSHVKCPAIDQSLMNTYIHYFRSCGFLP